MKIFKPRFWSSKINLFVFIFYPLSLLTKVFNCLKKIFIRPQKFNISIICVGNIYIGGTGKTPLAILLAKHFLKSGEKAAIIKKYYGSQSDEHNLIKANYENLILNSNRSKAIKIAEKEGNNIAILDDGFQDYRIKKNLNILCFNQNQKIGNGLVLPSGPLREGLGSIKDTQIIIINGIKDDEFEKLIYKYNKDVFIYYSKYVPINIEFFKNKKLLAFAGIGNPDNFFKILSDYDLRVEKKISFPDHYQFNNSEINNIVLEAKKNNYHIITTEKDYFRIKHLSIDEINYLKVELKIEKEKELMSNILKHL